MNPANDETSYGNLITAVQAERVASKADCRAVEKMRADVVSFKTELLQTTQLADSGQIDEAEKLLRGSEKKSRAGFWQWLRRTFHLA